MDVPKTRSESGAAGAVRLLAIGDCNTCGTTNTGPQGTVLDRVAARFRDSGLTIETQNLGATMNTSREGITRARKLARPADIVLLNFGLVDAWITSIPRIYIPYFPDSAIRRPLRKLLKSAKRRLRSPMARRFFPHGPVVPPDEYLQNFTEIVEVVREKTPGAKIVFWATMPVRNDEQRSANILRYNELLRTLASELNCHFVDTPDVLSDLSVDEAFLDMAHLSDTAAERVAHAVYQQLASSEGSTVAMLSRVRGAA